MISDQSLLLSTNVLNDVSTIATYMHGINTLDLFVQGFDCNECHAMHGYS